MSATSERIVMVSSDGHATARMRDYRPYLESRWHEEFDDFVKLYEQVGSRNFDPPALSRRTDPETVQKWIKNMVETDRLAGNDDPERRLKEMEREKVVAEVIFPDFGLPFQLYSPFLAASLGAPERSAEQLDAANRAYCRWVADFAAYAPGRFKPMAPVTLTDVDAALKELAWVKEAGLGGIVLPYFSLEAPLYHSMYDPIWSALEDLELIANVHAGMSGVKPADRYQGDLPHPTLGYPIMTTVPVAREMLSHMIWSGMLERHPRLKVVFTESGSGWIINNLRQMDYSYDGSYLSREIHDVMPLKPSEYFARQCYVGSSVFSRAEVEARHVLGLEKMMIGIDYPHHEGAWNGGTIDYLQATLGAAGVPLDEARQILGANAIEVFGFDGAQLAAVAERHGPLPEEVLTVPTEDKFPRGDVHKPL